MGTPDLLRYETVSSGITILDELLDGGYPARAMTVVHSIGAALERGQRYMIERALESARTLGHTLVMLKRPTSQKVVETLLQERPPMLVIEDWDTTAQDLSTHIPKISAVLNSRQLPQPAVLIFADETLIQTKVLRYFCHVRIHLYNVKGEEDIRATFIKNMVTARQGEHFVMYSAQ